MSPSFALLIPAQPVRDQNNHWLTTSKIHTYSQNIQIADSSITPPEGFDKYLSYYYILLINGVWHDEKLNNESVFMTYTKHILLAEALPLFCINIF